MDRSRALTFSQPRLLPLPYTRRLTPLAIRRMTYAKPRPKCPLPIAAKVMPEALVNLHQRLQGELEKAKSGEATLVSTQEALVVLDAIKTVLEFVRPDMNLAGVKPTRTRIPAKVFEYGGLRGNVLAVLRSAGGWLTIDELVAALIRRSRKSLDDEAARKFKQKVREACFALRKREFVEPEVLDSFRTPGVSTPAQRWRLGRAFRK